MLLKIFKDGQFDAVATGKIYAKHYARHYAKVYGAKAVQGIDSFFENHA